MEPVTLDTVKVEFIKLDKKATVPTYGTAFSAGADLYACMDEPITIRAGETALILSLIHISEPTRLL